MFSGISKEVSRRYFREKKIKRKKEGNGTDEGAKTTVCIVWMIHINNINPKVNGFYCSCYIPAAAYLDIHQILFSHLNNIGSDMWEQNTVELQCRTYFFRYFLFCYFGNLPFGLPTNSRVDIIRPYIFFSFLRCFGGFSLHSFSYMIFVSWRPVLFDCIIVCFFGCFLLHVDVRCVPFFTMILLLLLNSSVYSQKKGQKGLLVENNE